MRTCKSGHRAPEPSALYWLLASPVLASPGDAFLHIQTETRMLWLAIILLVAWVLGFAVFHVAGGLIHLLLVIALIVFIINLVSGRRAV